MVTKEEVEEIIGYPILKVKVEKDDLDFSQCSYEFNMYTSSVNNAVLIQYGTGQGGLEWFKMHRTSKESQPVSGLGEEAYWWPPSATLDVRIKEDKILTINLSLTSVELNKGDVKSLAIKLAQKALGRL